MKNVFQRTLSVIMCVVLVVCTMSTMAYAATDFTYDRFMDRTSKSVEMNISPAVDVIEEMLDEEMVFDIDKTLDEAGISIPGTIGVINLSSVNNMLKTLDDFAGRIEDITNIFAHLQTLTFSEFQKGMSRDSGDDKIITELVDLVGSNGDIFKDIFSGTFSLGAVDALFEGEEGEEGLSFSDLPDIAKEIFVAFVYDQDKEKDKYDAALTKAKSNFDKFICEDFIPAIVAIMVEAADLDPAQNKITISTNTTVNSLIAQVFDIILAYLKTTIGDLNIVLAGTSLDAIKDELILNGADYDLDKIAGFDGNKPVLDQVNTVVGQVFGQLVPVYMKNHTWGTDLGKNVSNVFRYLAAKVGITTGSRSDEAVMVDVLKKIFAEPEINISGDYSKCTNLEDIAKELIWKNIALEMEGFPTDVAYTSKQTYEHVIGDILIHQFADDVLIATPDGKICQVGEGYDLWSVWNYILNFFLVDKNFDLLIGKDGMTKTSSFFAKLDSICDMFAEDGSSSFATETYIKGLIKSVLDVDFNKFVDLTAGKALNFAKEGSGASGSVAVSKFVYKALYAVLRNWAGKRNVIPAWTTNPFHNAFKGTNLGNAVEAVLMALTGYKCNVTILNLGLVEFRSKDLEKVGTSRAPAIVSLLGLFVPGPETASIKVESVADEAVYTSKGIDPKAVVKATFAGKEYTLEQNVDYKVVVANKAIGSTSTIIEGMGAYKGTIAGENVTVKFDALSGLKAKPASASSVTLNWTALPGAESYNVTYGSTTKSVTTNSCTVTGLKAGTKYTFSVQAVGGGITSNKVSVAATTLPAQVSGVSASGTDTTATLKWSAVTGAAGYRIYDSNGKEVASTTGTSYTIKSLSANKTYKYTVRAYVTDTAGTKYNGAASSAVSVRTNPAKPASLTVKSAKATAVTLSWGAVSGATGYQIYDSNGTKIATTSGTSYTIKNLAANKTYSYKVRAYVTASSKTYYSSFTSVVSATTTFGTPKNLKVQSAKATAVTLAWDAVAEATGYQIYDSNGKKVATTSGTSYTVKSLTPNKAYKYKVRAYIKSGDNTYYSSYTSLLSASTTFGTPKSLKKKSVTASTITLSWGAVSEATGYEIYDSNGKKVGSTKKTSYTVKNLSTNKAYKYKVRAYITIGSKNYYGGYTSLLSASTYFATPKSLKVKEVTSSTVALTWKAVSNAAGYEIYDGNGKKVGSTTKTSFTVKKLSGYKKYKYKVRAYVKENGKTYYSKYSSTVSATTLLATPKSLKVKEATATSLTLSWKKVSGAKKYQVYYSTNGKTWKKATTTKTSYKIMDLKANTTYKVKVRVYNSSSASSGFTSVVSTSTAPAKVVISKLSAGKKKFTVTWKKVAGAEGYEVQYATNSSFKKAKTVKIKKGSTVKSEIKKLKKGTKYYVQVRAYKTVNGEKLYGKYSEYESVKVK